MAFAHTLDLTVERDGELRIDGLPLRAGDHVRVFVISEPPNGNRAQCYPLQGQGIRYDEPFLPAGDPDEWEANR